MDQSGDDANLIRTTYNAVDCLLELMPEKSSPDPHRRVLVATVVDLDQLESTSTFGRLTGEFIAARLTQKGFSVVHLTIRKASIVVTREGQFLLSRDIKKIAEEHNTGSVLVSTYTLAPYEVFMSLRLVNAEANTMVAAIDFSIPKGPQTKSLLGATRPIPGACSFSR